MNTINANNIDAIVVSNSQPIEATIIGAQVASDTPVNATLINDQIDTSTIRPLVKASTITTPVEAIDVQVDISLIDYENKLDEFSTKYDISKKYLKNILKQLLKNETNKETYMLFDNSGSMDTRDGKKHIINKNKRITKICTRLDELFHSIKQHLHIMQHLPSDNYTCWLHDTNGITKINPLNINSHIDDLEEISAIGNTPLCDRLNKIYNHIIKNDNRKNISIVIWTDGESSDGDVSKILKKLCNLGVSITVRLCTDQRKIIDYYNDLDNDREIKLDVIDDLIGESEEIHHKNPWLVYFELLHLFRDRDGVHKICDKLDESKFSISDIHTFCVNVLGIENLPDSNEFEEFINHLENYIRDQPDVYCNYTKRYKPLLDVRKIREIHNNEERLNRETQRRNEQAQMRRIEYRKRNEEEQLQRMEEQKRQAEIQRENNDNKRKYSSIESTSNNNQQQIVAQKYSMCNYIVVGVFVVIFAMILTIH